MDGSVVAQQVKLSVTATGSSALASAPCSRPWIASEGGQIFELLSCCDQTKLLAPGFKVANLFLLWPFDK